MFVLTPEKSTAASPGESGSPPFAAWLEHILLAEKLRDIKNGEQPISACYSNRNHMPAALLLATPAHMPRAHEDKTILARRESCGMMIDAPKQKTL